MATYRRGVLGNIHEGELGNIWEGVHGNIREGVLLHREEETPKLLFAFERFFISSETIKDHK